MAISTHISEHDVKWSYINRQLSPLGYTVTWMTMPDVDTVRYLFTKLRPFERLGYFDDETTAIGMAKVLATEGGFDFPWERN